MKRITVLLATAAVAIPLSFAQAADPFVTPSYDWTGAYFGIQGGLGEGDADHVNIVNGLPFGLTEPFGAELSGMFGGAHLGYDQQMGQMVIGLQVDGNITGMDGFVGEESVNDDGYESEVDWFGSARFRLGYAPSSMPDILLYGIGGLAMADVSGRNGDIDSPGNVFDCAGTGCAEGSETDLGFTIGAGVAKAFQVGSLDWVAGLEYAYYDFGKVSINTVTQPFGVPHSFDLDTHFHTVKATLSVKF